MALQPKTFRIDDYKLRALHDFAQKRGLDDGELIREILSGWLEAQDYNPFDYIAPLTPPASNTR